MVELDAALRDGAAALGVLLSERQRQQLLAYQVLIAKWSRVYNLTAITAPQEMLTHHLLDSLAVVPPLVRHLAEVGASEPARLLDVGSGAGLPGVVLAIALPDLAVTCVDAVAKKAAFIRQVAAELSLPNLASLHGRIEAQRGRYDLVCSRAFSSLADFVAGADAVLAPRGVWLALKGKRAEVEAEAASLSPAVELFHVEPLAVPGLGAERCLVWMRRSPAPAADGAA